MSFCCSVSRGWDRERRLADCAGERHQAGHRPGELDPGRAPPAAAAPAPDCLQPGPGQLLHRPPRPEPGHGVRLPGEPPALHLLPAGHEDSQSLQRVSSHRHQLLLHLR